MLSRDVETVVQECLAKCTLAVHLLGRHYGVTPEDSSESVPALQVRLTSQYAERKELQRLIWMPGSDSEDQRQRDFLRRVQEDPQLHHRVEIIEGNLNLLKKDLIRRLSPPRKSRRPFRRKSQGTLPSAMHRNCISSATRATKRRSKSSRITSSRRALRSASPRSTAATRMPSRCIRKTCGPATRCWSITDRLPKRGWISSSVNCSRRRAMAARARLGCRRSMSHPPTIIARIGSVPTRRRSSAGRKNSSPARTSTSFVGHVKEACA